MRSALYASRLSIVKHYLQGETIPIGSAAGSTKVTECPFREGKKLSGSVPSLTGLVVPIALPLMKREDARADSLADYVRSKRAELGWSLKTVEAQAARHGLKVAGSYVSRIENRIAKNPSKDKLIALARAFGVPDEEVFAAAAGKRPASSAPAVSVDSNEMRLLAFYRGMGGVEQETLLSVAEAMERSAKRKTTIRGVA